MAFLWCLASLLAFYLYLQGNTGFSELNHAKQDYTGDSRLLYTLKHPISILRWYFTLVGSCFAIRLPIDVTVSQIVGGLLTGIHVYIICKLKKLIQSKNYLLIYTFFFFLLTAAMVSMVRATDPYISGEFSYAGAINYRYRFVATLLLISTFLVAFRMIPKRFLNQLIIAIASITLLVYYTSMTHYKRIGKFTNELKVNMIEYASGKSVDLYYPNQKRAKKILNRSIELKIYRIPEYE